MNRFAFGENWQRFLTSLTEQRIQSAEAALQEWVGPISGKTFLDVGCGSGLSSLAARRLGAIVRSFDYDSISVECTRELKKRYFPQDADWHVERGDALDTAYLRSLGRFDVVYSWGVLHHTGDLWRALDNMVPLVKPGGHLLVALYNDQGLASRYWTKVKRLYNDAPQLRPLLIAGHAPYSFAARVLLRAITGRLRLERGMSYWRDHVDWIGGYPFEVARPDAVTAFFRERGMVLVRSQLVGRRQGCNEFVFRKPAPVHEDRSATPAGVSAGVSR